MNSVLHSRYVASITELKKNPMETVNNAFGEPIAILNRNVPAFYCVPAALYDKMMDIIEDRELLKLASELANEDTVKVSLNDLRSRVHKKRA